MKLCCCTIAFRDEPLERQLPRLRELGYDGAEVWMKHLEGRSDADLDALRRLAERVGLDLEVVAPYMWLTQTPELLMETYRIVERAIACARRLGCPKIRTFTDSGPTGIGSDRATPAHWASAVTALRRITAMAPDLRFVVETHGQTLADTPASTLRLLHEVGAPNLCVNFQPSRQFGLADAWGQLRDHVEHMHLHNQTADGKGTWVEEGVVDFAALLQRIAADGYGGSISVEYCFGGATWERVASAREFVARNFVA